MKLYTIGLGCVLPGLLAAAAPAENLDAAAGTNAVVATDPRFGLLDGLDHRSAYYEEFFPQPLLVDDTGLEPDGELEFASLSTRAGSQRSDMVSAGVQQSFGLLTVELSVPYEYISDGDSHSQGVGSLDLGVRYPLYQFVSDGKFFDSTFGVAMEAGLPVNSEVSKNTELTPKVFDDVKLGENFSVQAVLGYSTLLGGGDQGGLRTFEYGFDFGWQVSHRELPLPGVQQFIPMLELSGETELNQADAGQNSLLGSLGFRLNLKPIGDLQPSLGLGYVFPVDNGAHAEVHYGLATSLTFDF
jgi:hypothetical protein